MSPRVALLSATKAPLLGSGSGHAETDCMALRCTLARYNKTRYNKNRLSGPHNDLMDRSGNPAPLFMMADVRKNQSASSRAAEAVRTTTQAALDRNAREGSSYDQPRDQ
jgi:hypothetical protein